jgi:hypothetical protein
MALGRGSSTTAITSIASSLDMFAAGVLDKVKNKRV